MKDKYISLINVIFILLVSMAITGCVNEARRVYIEKNAVDTLSYVRQHKGEGLRRTVAGSEVELMNTVVKNMGRGGDYIIVREPHAVLAKHSSVNLSYAFYFYPSQTNGQTEVEVLVASPWGKAEDIQKDQEWAFSSVFFDINRQIQEKGFDPNVKVKGTRLVLSIAALDGDMKTAKKLINIGAKPDLAIEELNEYASNTLSIMNKYVSDISAIETGSEPKLKPDPEIVARSKLKVDKANLAIEMLNGLKIKAKQSEAEKENDARFQDAFRTRQKTAINLQMPEAARRFKVQAEDAVREKKFDDAADLYKQALNIDPLWPEGHFNRALVLGETGDYEAAAREMKRYLLLVPNASDARAAQDKIYTWERKVQE